MLNVAGAHSLSFAKTIDIMNYKSTTNQRILGDFVARDVLLLASVLVSDLMDKGLLSVEDIENAYYYPCPLCGEAMQDHAKDLKMLSCTSCKLFDSPEDVEQTPKEIYEWWFVTPYLYEKLQQKGEPVINSNYGCLWGRCATGQAILLDGVIGEIAEDMQILEGQQNDWSKEP
jgi:hypothetical protein